MHKLKSKWIKDLNINLTTLNMIEEKVGSSLQDMDTGDHFLGRTPVAQTIRATVNKWNLLNLSIFCTSKDTLIKTKIQPTDWENIFNNPSSDKVLISKIHKKLKKLDTKTLFNPIKNGVLNWTENSQQKKLKCPKDT